MTGSPEPGAPARDGSAGSASLRSAVGAIGVMLAVGLAFRLIMAYLYPPLAGSGFDNDLASFRGWANDLATNGPAGFYTRPGFHDYTPGYLYALWAVGVVGRRSVAWATSSSCRRSCPTSRSRSSCSSCSGTSASASRGRGSARSFVLINPITWFDSVVWGQVDSVGVVFMLLGVRELWKGRHERAAILTVVAALIKPQLGILIPIVAWVTVRRALWPQGAYGDDPEPEPSGFAWERRPTTPVRILTTGLAGLLTAVILSAPFGLSVVGLTAQIGKTAAGYPYLTVNAYNPWALVTTDVNGQAWGLAQNGGWVCNVRGPPTRRGADRIACSPQDNAAHADDPGSAARHRRHGAAGARRARHLQALVARRPDRLTILVGVPCWPSPSSWSPPGSTSATCSRSSAWRRSCSPSRGAGRSRYVVSAWRRSEHVRRPGRVLRDPQCHDWLGIGDALRSSSG